MAGLPNMAVAAPVAVGGGRDRDARRAAVGQTRESARPTAVPRPGQGQDGIMVRTLEGKDGFAVALQLIRLLAIILAVTVINVAPATADEPATAQDNAAETSEAETLDGLVTQYFKATQNKNRKRLGLEVARVAGGQIELVAASLGSIQLWSPQAPGVTEFEMDMGKGRKTLVSVRVPAGYDHEKRYPLILALHGQGGRGKDSLQYLEYYMRDLLDDFIVAAPTDYRGTWFNSEPEEAQDPPAMLKELRQRYHLDTNRVYAFGYSAGGHSSWLLATLYTDELASAIPLAGTLILPVPQAHPLLLTNLNNLPVLAVWGEGDNLDDKGSLSTRGGIAGINRRIDRLGAEMNLPINAVELAGVGHGNVTPPLDRVGKFLKMRREPAPLEVSHWFRYPPQGRIAWLRQRKFAGRPWAGNQISISTPLGADLDEYVTRFLEKKLAYLGGHIDGQRIEVESRRSAEIEVLLNADLIDLERPITLVVGKKKRFEGKVDPSVQTMLEVAHQDWEFQRLYPVRLVTRSRSKAWQE